VEECRELSGNCLESGHPVNDSFINSFLVKGTEVLFLLCLHSFVLHINLRRFFVLENRRSPKHLEALTLSSSCKTTVTHVYDRMRDTLYCRRSICIVSSVPLVATFERILRSLHDAAVTAQPSAVVDSISNLLNDISMPALGTSLRLTVPNGTLVCQRPGKHRLNVYLNSSDILPLFNQQVNQFQFCFLLKQLP